MANTLAELIAEYANQEQVVKPEKKVVKQVMVRVVTHAYLNDTSVVDEYEMPIHEAREFLAEQLVKRAPCSIYKDGALYARNFPNTYAMCPMHGMLAQQLWNSPSSEEADDKLLELRMHELY